MVPERACSHLSKNIKELIIECGCHRSRKPHLKVSGTNDILIGIFYDIAVLDAVGVGAGVAIIIQAELALDHTVTMRICIKKPVLTLPAYRGLRDNLYGEFMLEQHRRA
jgi:hypothetical protein